MDYYIRPRGILEEEIVSSQIFRQAIDFGESREGHSEGKVGMHIRHILDYIDRQSWDSYKADLRLITLLHDLGKFQVKRSKHGYIIGKPHAVISEEIAKSFISDEEILRIIKYHDKNYSFYRKEGEKGKFDKQKFIELFKQLDLDLLIRFSYADSCDRSREPIEWFENKCKETGLISVDYNCLESRLEVIFGKKKEDFAMIRQLIGAHGENYLLNGLLDPRAQGGPGMFCAYLKSIFPFYEHVYKEIAKQELNEKEKRWFREYEQFYRALVYYLSPGFLKDYMKMSKREKKRFMMNLIKKVANQLDKLCGSEGRILEDVLQETNGIRININGAMVPLNILRREDLGFLW